MRPSNAPSNVALYKNLESVVTTPHLLEKTPAKNLCENCLAVARGLGVTLAAVLLAFSGCSVAAPLPLTSTRLTDVKTSVASRSHCQTIWERVKRNRSPGGTTKKAGC